MAELSTWLFIIALHLGSLVIEPRLLVVDKSGAVQQVVAGQAVSGDGADHFWLWAYGRAPRRVEVAEYSTALEELRRAPRTVFEVDLLPAEGSGNSTREFGGFLLAAPVEMWAEVPEDLLPRFPISSTGAVSVTAARSGLWRFRFFGKGMGSFWHDQPISAKPRSPRSRVTLAVLPATDKNFEIVSSQGSPISNAVLEFAQSRNNRPTPAAWARLATTTEGRVTVPGLPAAEPMVLGVHSPGFISAFARGSLAGLPNRFVLETGKTISGQIAESADVKLEGGLIEAEWWAPGERALIQKAKTSADKQGRFRLIGLPPGKTILTFQFAELATKRLEVEVGESSVLDLGVIQLLPAASLHVRVLAAQDESPIGGAHVSCASPGMRSFFETTTDPDGSAHCRGLSPEEGVHVRTAGDGYRAETAFFLPAADTIHEVRLEKSFTVTGRYLDTQGTVPQSATCLLKMSSRSTSCTVASDGSFRLEPEPEQPFVLVFRSASTLPLELEQDAGALGEERDLGTVYGSAGSRLVGRVLDDGGNTLTFVKLRAARPVAEAERAMVLLTGGGEAETKTDANGEFELSGLSPGDIEVRLEAPGFAPLRVPVTIGSDEEVVDVGDIRVSGGAIIRVVLGFDSSPSAKAVLSLNADRPQPDQRQTSFVEREAQFEQVGSGRHRVRVLDPHLVCERTLEIQGQKEARVECLHGRPKVFGLVTQNGGATPARGRLVFSLPPGQDPVIVLNSGSPGGLRRQEVLSGEILRPIDVEIGQTGTFETGDLAAGRWLVTWISEDGTRSSPRELWVPEQREVAVHLDFG